MSDNVRSLSKDEGGGGHRFGRSTLSSHEQEQIDELFEEKEEA